MYDINDRQGYESIKPISLSYSDSPKDYMSMLPKFNIGNYNRSIYSNQSKYNY